MHKRYWSSWLSCLLLVCATGVVCAATAKPDPAAILRAKYASLQEQLRHNPFKRPLVLDSAENSNHLKGDIYAVVDYPFGAVSVGLNNPDHWCDVLILHINTKYCHAEKGSAGTVLKVNVGRKTPQELSLVPRAELDYRAVAATKEYFATTLTAKEGPLGTSDYLIRLEAAALPNAKTFLHLTYSYAMNFSAQVSMQTYLATIGSDKVGFTVIGKQADGRPEFVGGERGLVERNTMRYYLAIDTYLETARAVPSARLEKRLQGWFTAVERYPQLHEMDRATYLEMKRAEYSRQQTVH